METANWTTNRIDQILPEEFYELISSNKTHISKTFPGTLAACPDSTETAAFIANNIEAEKKGENYFFYIRNTVTKKLIGYVCIKKIEYKIMKCELAYFIDKDFEGMGIISQAVSETIDFCFNGLQMNKVFICTSKVNLSSQRIATKHGFRQEGILRQEFKNGDGFFEDIIYFGLLKSEYHER